MKLRNLLALTALAGAAFATAALAQSYTTAIQRTDNNLTIASGGTLTVASGATLNAASGSTVSLAGTQTFTSTLTRTMAPSADSATTNKGIVTNLTSPVDTTGTNTHNAFDVGITIGNATGGTNSVRGLNVGNVTGDAQVNVTGVRVGTGTILGTGIGMFVDSGWDTAQELNVSASADSGNTNIGMDVDLTTPVDTTGTNTHYGLNIDTVIGNATGGTNTATAINIANVTGDAQVTETGISIGTGFDTGLSVGSPVSITSTITGDGGDALSGFTQKQVASTTTSATIAQCGSTFVSDSTDVITLPEASTALGCRYTFVCGTADDFDVNPADGTDQISVVNSVAGGTGAAITPAAGDAIRCTDIGSSIALEAVGANLWVTIGVGNGAWTDVN